MEEKRISKIKKPAEKPPLGINVSRTARYRSYDGRQNIHPSVISIHSNG
jgi:hypothetical protein